jgi:hypothetical protein
MITDVSESASWLGNLKASSEEERGCDGKIIRM